MKHDIGRIVNNKPKNAKKKAGSKSKKAYKASTGLGKALSSKYGHAKPGHAMQGY